MYKLAIFDFDGTLVDSAKRIVDVMRVVADEYKFGPELFESWTSLIGSPLVKQMETLFPEKSMDFRNEVANRYRAIYDHKVLELSPPFPYLNQMLDALFASNIDIAIASSKRKGLIDPVLKFHNLTKYFKIIIGSQEVTNHKPDPESVHIIVDKLKIPYEHSIVIGDSTFDIEMARNANVDSIAVTTGIHDKEILAQAQPSHIVDDLKEVLSLILNGKTSKKI